MRSAFRFIRSKSTISDGVLIVSNCIRINYTQAETDALRIYVFQKNLVISETVFLSSKMTDIIARRESLGNKEIKYSLAVGEQHFPLNCSTLSASDC